MAHFTQDYIDFFQELSTNNNRDWFHENKKRYDKNIRGAFIDFITALLHSLENEWGVLPYQAREFLMRINRDIRFSKDKTPYNTHMGAMLSPYGKKNMTRPGIYITANHLGIEVYTGCYLLEKDNLYQVRKKIMDHLDEFNSLITNNKFKAIFGEVQGDKHKRLPKEFQEAAVQQPLIYNKGLYYGFQLPKGELLANDLIDQVLDGYHVAKGLNDFLEDALTK